MLHISKIYKIIERVSPGKGKIPFNIKYIKKNGDEVEYNNVVCTSSHYDPQTINIMLSNGQVKKLRCNNITHINNIEIML